MLSKLPKWVCNCGLFLSPTLFKIAIYMKTFYECKKSVSSRPRPAASRPNRCGLPNAVPNTDHITQPGSYTVVKADLRKMGGFRLYEITLKNVCRANTISLDVKALWQPSQNFNLVVLKIFSPRPVPSGSEEYHNRCRLQTQH